MVTRIQLVRYRVGALQGTRSLVAIHSEQGHHESRATPHGGSQTIGSLTCAFLVLRSGWRGLCGGGSNIAE